MKKFILNSVIFAVFGIIFYIVSLVTFGKLAPAVLIGNLIKANSIMASDGSAERFTGAEHHDPVDLLILGSSHAYRGYDVRIFRKHGLQSYNLGSSAQPLSHTHYIYNRYIDTFKPKLLIIDIYPILFNSTEMESVLNTIPLFYKDEVFFGNMILRTKDIRLINSFIYLQLFGNIKDVSDKIRAGDKYIDGGFVETWKAAVSFRTFKKTELKIKKENLKALQNIVNDARTRGIKVYLIQSPIPRHHYNSYTNNAQVDSLLRTVSNYYNFNEEASPLKPDHFFDDGHINQRGVKVFNQWVLEKLIRTKDCESCK